MLNVNEYNRVILSGECYNDTLRIIDKSAGSFTVPVTNKDLGRTGNQLLCGDHDENSFGQNKEVVDKNQQLEAQKLAKDHYFGIVA